MLDFINGYIDSSNEKEAVVVCGGIGYLLSCSYNTLIHLQGAKGEVKVYTYLSVKETGIELFGFFTKEEREMFFKLLEVSKVGPKVALSILSLYTPQEIVKLIVLSDVKGLSRPSGVGKKLAESIVFNLKDKFKNIDDSELFVENADPMAFAGEKDEAMLALVSLGFERSLAIKLINDVYKEEMPVKQIISLALQSAGK